jgi:hypothetical protein
MKFFWIGLVLLMSIKCASAQVQHYKPLKSHSRLQDKVFYFFTLLEQPACSIPLQKDTVLSGRLQSQIAKVGGDSTSSPNALARDWMWTSDDMDRIGTALCNISLEHPKMRAWLTTEMRHSGYWIRYSTLDDTALIRKGWQEAALAQNKLIQHYTTNKGFRYNEIDSATLAPESAKGQAFMGGILRKVYDAEDSMHLFFQPGLALALRILEGNKRDEAIRFEPLDSTNKVPYARIPHTDWKKYGFSAILVLGAGPDGDSAISSTGKERCQQGAIAWKQKRAPFIIVSGGFVHPFQTPYCEADQMKKYLIKDLGVPEEAIILEPQARHTTTNIRNANRILIRKGFPLKKRVLCISSPLHVLVVESPLFAARCTNEMGYVPYKEMTPGKNKSECAYAVSEAALQLDATDPLDP